MFKNDISNKQDHCPRTKKDILLFVHCLARVDTDIEGIIFMSEVI